MQNSSTFRAFFVLFAGTVGLGGTAPLFADTVTIPDAGFEMGFTDTGSNHFEYGSGVSPSQTWGAWQFNMLGGLIHNPQGAWAMDMPNPEGSQVALLQTYPGWTPGIVRGATGLELSAGVTYTVSFYQASRPSGPGVAGNLDYTLKLLRLSDSSTQTLFSRSTSTGESWTQYTQSFSVGATALYVLSFEVTTNDGRDSTIYVDAVSMTSSAVPEPSSFAALAAMAALGACGVRRRRRAL